MYTNCEVCGRMADIYGDFNEVSDSITRFFSSNEHFSTG
jgi:hypothetical protein